MNTSLSRRHVMAMVAALSGASFVGCGLFKSGLPIGVYDFLGAEVQAAERVGKRWLKGLEPPPTAQELLEAVFGSELPKEDTPPEQIRATIIEKIAADFQESRAEWHDNWFMSRTELEVCGFLALTKDDRPKVAEAEEEPPPEPVSTPQAADTEGDDPGAGSEAED